MNLDFLDIAVIVIYFWGLFAGSIYISRKNKSTEDYFLGGHSIPGWAIGISMVGTALSAVTFLSAPADTFKVSWIRVLGPLAMPLAALLASYYFIPFYKKMNVTTAYEFLKKRFGSSIRIYASSVFIFAQLIRISTILFLVGVLMKELTGIDFALAVILAGLFVSIYTILGGFEVVIWTDVVQTIVLIGGAILIIVIVVLNLPEGFSQIFDVGMQYHKFSFAELKDGMLHPLPVFELSFEKKTVAMMLLYGLASWIVVYASDQNSVQRYAAAKDLKSARNALWLSAVIIIITVLLFKFVGTTLFVFYHIFPTELSQAIHEGTAKAEHIVPHFIINNMHYGVRGIVLSAALSAAMSSLDSNINAISTVGVVDIYKRYVNPGKSDKYYLTTAKVFAVITSVIMIIGAYILNSVSSKTLSDTITILVSLFSGGLGGLFVFGMFSKKGGSREAWLAIFVTMAFTLWSILAAGGKLPDYLTTPFDLYYTVIVSNLLMFFVLYILTRFQRKNIKTIDDE